MSNSRSIGCIKISLATVVISLGFIFPYLLTDHPTSLAQSGPAASDELHAVTPAEIGEAVQIEQANLVRTIDTSHFTPPSPDPVGILYFPSTGRFFMSDSEVDEENLFTGVNLFDISMPGALVGTHSTLPYSKEPTALAVNPRDQRLFITDDNEHKVFEVAPGDDHHYNTDDDVITSLDTEAFSSRDPEGLAFDAVEGHLFILDDHNQTIYEVSPGANGTYDGILPVGDDYVTPHSIATLGLRTVEGLTYNSSTHHLYVVGKAQADVYELTMTGRLVRVIDITSAHAYAPSDLVFAPSSLNPAVTNLYVTDRGVDNEDDPSENDGKIYEFSVPAAPQSNNKAPKVDAGSKRNLALPVHDVSLDGTVSDDGVPAPAKVTTLWSQLQGPAKVAFADAKKVDTKVTLPKPGIYVLRLLADDGVATASDAVTLTLTATNTAPVVDAGPTLKVDVSEPVTLTASVVDDNLPNPPGAVTTEWALLDGPNSATIATPDAMTTMVSFSVPGFYVFHLTASDGELTAGDDVLIEVVGKENRILVPFAVR